ncbi:hypothetical protein ABBQ32_002763 [Trebouxia sp. C0010 RCD-2024]
MAASEALQRASSWPQTQANTATGQYYQIVQYDPNSHIAVYALPPDANGFKQSSPGTQLVLYQPQCPALQHDSHSPQQAELHDSALARYPSADSALAIQAYLPKPSIPAFLPQSPAHLAVFGDQFVAVSLMETFYVCERPTKLKPSDGVIKTPVLGHPGQFQDGFKVDMTAHWMSFERVLRDLPDNNIVCCQRRKIAAINPTILICSGSSMDTSKLVATVRKAGNKKAFVELEKKGHIQYTVEGDLLQRNYMVKLNSTQVAQVSHDDMDARVAVTTRHSYSVQVAPGTDCVLMIAAAMAIEDIYT